MFSTFQLNSPSERAPTMRPLPLSVWHTSRIGRLRSRSVGGSVGWRGQDYDHRAVLGRLVEHAGGLVLEVPTEVAPAGRGAEGSSALWRVERAPGRARALEVAGACAPDRPHPVEVGVLLAELIEGHLADFVVDLVT